ncbi:MAG: isoprenyl transferase [Candidatus Omnitrophota bacterium]
MNNPTNKPGHIAIIMDGNGRWAKNKGLPRLVGHRRGVDSVREAVEGCVKLGVKILTLYAFSTENFKRPKREVNILMALLKKFLAQETKNLKKNNIRLNAIGRISELPDYVKKPLRNAINETVSCGGLLLNLALNYGSRCEITDACSKISKGLCERKIKPEDINEHLVSSMLYTKGMPDPDLIIRTSGETRLSNFLLWQASYSELYFTKKYWPDFHEADLKKAIGEYKKRQRRYGAI